MEILSRPPVRIVQIAVFALILGSLAGTLALLVFEAWRSPDTFSASEALGLGLGISMWAALIGLFVIALYAAPLLVLLRRAQLGGPVSALAIGLLPALLLFSFHQNALAGFFFVYGLSVSLIFCGFSYRRRAV